MTRQAISIAIAIGFAIITASASSAHAAVNRYALVIGNDAGDRDEVLLRYAERDADRMAAILVELGSFEAANVTVLHGGDAEGARAALIAINDRIRTTAGESMLVVYYSGHADADALHLGPTALPISQLEQLVRGSAATFRLLVLDSCRSGALTRVKGGKPVPAFPIVLGDSLAADGVVFWTASAASEDAQESDDVKGSFFTHFLVSGLAGPADLDGDGRVTIGEAYDYARIATLRASSRTLAGTQHPTFRDELRGRVDVVLTTPGRSERRARLRAPVDREMLVFAGTVDGPVVAEIGAHDRTRLINVRPGRYFVRERTPRYLLEGTVTATAGSDDLVDDNALHRVDYAQLARKGTWRQAPVDHVEAGFAMQTPLVDGGSACIGATAGYRLDLSVVAITPRFTACRERFRSDFVESVTSSYGADVRLSRDWRLWRASAGVQIEVGGALLHQTFDTDVMSAPTSIGALTFGAGGFADVPIAAGIGVHVGIEVNSYVMRRDELLAQRWDTVWALRAIAAIDWRL